MSNLQKRTVSNLGSPGPFLATVVNHGDTTYSGNLNVRLMKAVPTFPIGHVFQVRYLSPFLGSTSRDYEGNDEKSFNDVQKSYGFWMVPPDIGSTVMVIFIDGEPNEGYWIGCTQGLRDEYQNHMIPGIAASNDVHLSTEQKRKYDTEYLPTAEFLKKTNKEVVLINKIKKPVHPFADVLLKQGLLVDEVRGVTSSGARREFPSQVFGISTPGPFDKKAPQQPIGEKGQMGYVSRLGGSTFVMDDGDRDGNNELVRIRTRTGHQILLHNTKDLIYIANGAGTAWIELTSNGKIDIYAKDSVSIRTENDFNFRADRDVNIEAGRNINIRANAKMNIEAGSNYSLYVTGDSKIYIQEDKNETVVGSSFFNVKTGESHYKVGQSMFVEAGGDCNLAAKGTMRQSSGADFNIVAGGTYKETATKIYMNGPSAEPTQPASSAAAVSMLPRFSLPNTDVTKPWNNKNRYKTNDLSSILKRVPTHEPWPQHEDPSVNEKKYTPDKTDITK